jgi:very-short-patch-repair endonuclease
MDGFVRTRDWDGAISEVAGRQHGVVARGQLSALGLGSEAIEWRLRHGRLHRLYWGVYAVGHTVLSQEGRWMAAVFACGQGAVLSHRSAAAHWGIRDHRGGPIDVTSPRKTKSRGSIRRHSALLPADEVTEERGIPITTVPRTIFDLAAVSTPHAAESALRQSEFLRLYDPLSLHDLTDRYPGHRGIRSVSAALARVAEAPGPTVSRLEDRFLPFLDRHDLPRPHLNVRLEVNGRRFQVDCLWPSAKQIVELDGWEGHGTRTAFREDRARDRRLRVAGYGVTRIAWGALDDEPEVVASDLRSLLQRQSSPYQYKRP